MHALLVYPKHPATFWSLTYALPFINKKAILPPLGLLTVSKLLPKDWNRKLVDLNIATLTDGDLLWADIVLVSGMIVQKKSAEEVIRRASGFSKFVVAGGPLFTASHAEIAGVNSCVLNEAEITLPLFLADFAAGKPKRLYTSTEKADVAQSPIPDWSLVRMKDYASMAVQMTRGCPFNCDFCNIVSLDGRVPRVKSPQQVVDEFDSLYNAGWRGNVFVVDDNFIGNRSKALAILTAVSEWTRLKKRPFGLYTEASINLADDPQVLGLMQKTNFHCVFVGIETPEEAGLQSCGKVQNTGKNLEDKVRILQRSGLQVQAGFIVGFDTDTPRTFENVRGFIQRSGIVTAMVGLLTALPETRLYKRLQDAGRIVETSSGNNTDCGLNFVPTMRKDLLIDGYKNLVATLFTPENYYERVRAFLRQYKRRSTGTKFALRHKLRALVAALWSLGVRGDGKMSFWRMFVWTAVRRPSLMTEAITLAIYGFHYRTVLANSSNGV
jgi:radical SAM superfamily enzyme YgiQ (UPF0313 family)